MPPDAPCEGAKIVSFTMGLRLRHFGRMMPLLVAMNLPFRGSPFSSGRLLFGGHDLLERLFEDEFDRGEI